MRTVLRGLLVGFLLSMLRAPRGLDLFEIPLASSANTLGWRAVALALCGIALGSALRRPGFVLLLSAAAGFAVHGLLLANGIAPRSTFGLALTAFAGLVLVLAVCLDERKLDEPPEPPHANRPAFMSELLGLFAAGAGAALAVEAVARHLRPFGGGLAQDDTVFGIAFLLLLALGAGALGWVARHAFLRHLALPFGLAASATACFVSLGIAATLVKTPELERYTRGFGITLTEHGTLAWDLLVGAALLVVPALLAGFALAGVRTRRQAAAVLFGAAQGMLLSGSLLRGGGSITASDEAWYAAQLVPIGALLAVAGAALAIASAPGVSRAARYTALACALALAAVPLTREALGLPLRAPWDDSDPRSPRMFQSTFDVPEGLATVEARGPTPWIATLDGKELTGGIGDTVAEEQRLQLSVACISAERRARGALTVLLIGQLDPLRAVVLRQLGVTRVDRSAAWHAVMARLEGQLFSDKEMLLPEGEILAPEEARRRAAEGRYDLVLVPPVSGDAPTLRALDVPETTMLPETTTLVVWLATEAPLAHLDLGGDVLLSSDGLDALCVGIARNAHAENLPPTAMPHWSRTGKTHSAPSPLGQLRLPDGHRFRERTLTNRMEWIDRLHATSRGMPDEPLYAGIHELYRAQIRSSPFESGEQQVELADAGLDQLLRHVLATTPDVFVRGVWEALARILAGKRDVERVRRYIQPAAERHKPWPALEKALARADLESLEPAEAVRRLEAIAVLAVSDFDYWHLLGEARKAGGDSIGATRAWRKALDLRPAHQVLKRRLAILLVRTGEPGGRELVEALLQANPSDAKLRAFLEPGPWPDEEQAAPAGR